MTFEFSDSAAFVVNADFLNLFEPDQFIETRKRATFSEDFVWWLRCYPNGNIADCEGHVSVYIHTFFSGFDAEWTVTIDRSDYKSHGSSYHENPMCHGYPMLVSHETIRSGKIIRNGSFVIRCEIHFKIELDKLTINKITFNRKTTETYKTGQEIIEKKRTVDGITWWIQYYPSGLQSTDKGYISVYFYVEGGPIKADFSCAMSIGDDIIQKRVSEACEKCDNWGDNKWFSHKQCQIANHNNDVIDLVCQITFTKPFPTPQNDSTLLQSVNKITKTCIEDAVTFTILECQLELNEVGDFDSTPKKFAERSGRHQWRILYFPAGDLNRSKGHISLHIEASTTEAETVILSGVIKIDGTPFEKKFKMFVENEDSSLAFSKLITHEELRGIGGIINNQIVFICEVLFET